MLLTVLFFAKAREYVEKTQDTFDVNDDCSVSALVKHVVAKYPELEALLPTMVLSVNLDYVPVDSNMVLKAKDEIAFIPPISGG